MKRHLAVIFILLFAVAALAQSSRHKRQHKQPEQPHMDSAKQSVEMKKMTDTFVGMWKTTATVEKGPMFPMAGTSEGRSDFRSGPAGNSLIERNRSHGVMGLYAGMGVFWWDAQAAAYKALWCDSLAADGCSLMGNGQWDTDGLVFKTQVNMGQDTMQIQETYSKITTDSFTFTLETGMDEAPLVKTMTVQYERVQPKTTVVAPPVGEPSATAPAGSTPQ
jgi:Protein of unknown function (DUF1579)